MLGIVDLLNNDDQNRSSDDTSKLALRLPQLLDLPPSTAGCRVGKLPSSRVHPSLLKGRNLVDIALRRKSTLGRRDVGLKLHLKLLEAGLRVRLVLCPLMYDLFRQLTPHTARKNSLYRIDYDESTSQLVATDVALELKRPFVSGLDGANSIDERSRDGIHRSMDTGRNGQAQHNENGRSRKAICKRVRLIDPNLVNLAGVSGKVLKLFQVGNETPPPVTPTDGTNDEPGIVTTFNLLDTAVWLLFSIHDYTLVRVTRLLLLLSDGLVLLKLETARPGDVRLIDDKTFRDDMLMSLGKEGQLPNNLFIKKVVARPRYKSDMKIYIVPKHENMLLYVNCRVFERDVINGVVDLDRPLDRQVYTTFPPSPVLADVRDLVARLWLLAGEPADPVPHHLTSVAPRQWGLLMGLESLVLLVLLTLLPLLMLSHSAHSVGTEPPEHSGKLQLIPNADNGVKRENLHFDTSYLA